MKGSVTIRTLNTILLVSCLLIMGFTLLAMYDKRQGVDFWQTVVGGLR